MEEVKREFFNPKVPMDFQYNNRVGPCIQKLLDGFGEKKIYGSRCPSCGKVVVPPRTVCGACNAKMEGFVEVAQEGILRSFTVGHVYLEKGQIMKADSPYVIGLVELDGVDSLFLARISGVEPSEVKEGMRVKAAWKDQVQGDYADLDHFRPA